MDTVYQYHENQKDLVNAFEQLDFADSSVIMELGKHAQVNISELSESVLEKSKSLRSQEIFKTLEETIDELTALQNTAPATKWTLPFTRRRAKDYTFLNWGRSAENRMDVVAERLREHQVDLMKNIVMLDEYARMNRVNYAELEEAMRIGQNAILKMREEKQAYIADNLDIDPKELELYWFERDHQRERIEIRLQELQLSWQVSLQLAEQLLVLKHNDQLMADKIQGILWNTLVLWKNQIVLMMEQGYRTKRDFTIIDQRNRDLINHLSEMVRMKNEGNARPDPAQQTPAK